jgi:hypothetical protein
VRCVRKSGNDRIVSMVSGIVQAAAEKTENGTAHEKILQICYDAVLFSLCQFRAGLDKMTPVSSERNYLRRLTIKSQPLK